MTKKEVKEILLSLKTQENERLVNNLLGKIDMLDEKSMQLALDKVGNNKNGVKKFFEDKLNKRYNDSEEKYPINDLFTYGVTENCIHLHLPVDLHNMLKEKGIFATIDTINLNLLDAIDKIKQLKDNGFYRFIDKNTIYMISPILKEREMQFLQSLNFQTHLYKKQALNDEHFIESNPEAKLAINIFGKDKSIGTASISFETISSSEWQDKKTRIINELTQKGITLKDNSNEK